MNPPFLTHFLFVFLMATTVLCQAGEPEPAAIKAAESWLALVDSKKYSESWKEAAPFFKEKISEQAWDKMISSVRDPMGKMESRVLLGSQFMTSLPGAPDGKYVVIQFKTNFAGKPDSVETITPMLDEAGVWRVSGYFIK